LREAVRRWEALGEPHGLGEALLYLGYAADVGGARRPPRRTTRRPRAGWARRATGSARGSAPASPGGAGGGGGELASAVGHIRAALRTSVALRDRWLLVFAAQATVVLVRSRARPAAWERLLGATFGWEHVPGAEHVAGLREQLARVGERSAA